MSVKINKLLLKYIVPFSYNAAGNLGAKNVTDILCKKFGFKLVNPVTVIYSESDFLENINDLFETQSVCSIGSAFEKKNGLPVLCDMKGRKITIDSCEIYLFKSGIGFFRYKVTPDRLITDDPNELLLFCNAFKELSYNRNDYHFYILEKERIEFESENITRAITNKDKISEFLDSCGFDLQDNEKLLSNGSLNVSLDENDKIEKITPSDKEGVSLLHICRKRDFFSGKWIASMLADIPELHFTPQRSGGVPDTALQMSYTYLSSESQDDTYDYIFRISHGYNNSYNRCANNIDDIYTPFADDHFLISETGMAQCAVQSSNKQSNLFFENEALNRSENYYFIYLLILQQYYGLLYQSGRAACVVKDNNEKNTSLESLKNLVCDMNVFSVRNMFSKISYISNYNNFYSYAKQMLAISDIYEQTSQCLVNMTDMIEKSEAEHHDDMLYIFTIIGAVFAISEVIATTSDIVSHIIPNSNDAKTLWIWTGFIVLMMLIVSIILWLIRGVLKSHSKKISNKKNRKNKGELSDKGKLNL